MTGTAIRCQVVKMLQTSEGPLPLDLSFQVEKGSFLTIYGRSGAGKTTLLRILAGLTDPEEGSIVVEEETWLDTGRSVNLAARKRSVGLVFQDFALFPHLSVKGNLLFALKKGEDRRLVDELIEIMELGALQDSRPAQLSGGQQQRVALARAIARKPRLLLLDEPLSALDDEMRHKLQDCLLEVHRHYHLTTILVSHHLPEIFRLSDEVICLEKGRIQQRGRPADIFTEGKISGKFRITGEIVDITPSDIVYIITVLSANTLFKVIATAEEITALQVGDKVMVASKAFNPIVLKLG